MNRRGFMAALLSIPAAVLAVFVRPKMAIGVDVAKQGSDMTVVTIAGGENCACRDIRINGRPLSDWPNIIVRCWCGRCNGECGARGL